MLVDDMGGRWENGRQAERARGDRLQQGNMEYRMDLEGVRKFELDRNWVDNLFNREWADIAWR